MEITFGAGRILAGEIKRSLALDFEHFISRGGLVLGICNGFQVLVKAGILPGNNKQSQVATITFNDSGKFECRWVYLSVNPNSNCVFTSGLEKLYLPVAHGEGKFLAGAKILGDIDTPVFYTDRAGNKVWLPLEPQWINKNIAGYVIEAVVFWINASPGKTYRALSISSLDQRR